MTVPSAIRRITQADWFATSLTGIAVILCMTVLYIAQPPLISRLDWKIYDTLLPLRAMPTPSPVPVIIDLDETSLAEYGQWPWPRYLVADLLYALNAYQVAAVGLDIMFAEPDRASPDHLRESLKRDKSATLNLDNLPSTLRDYDQLLAKSLQKTPAVLGFYSRFDRTAKTLPFPADIKLVSHASPGAIPLERTLQSAKSAILPLPVLRNNAPAGFI
ncbi:MAG: CHASE2 domain-containing protein, partial [Burkholderiaceae bacterium]|nr:CHASE2 domain-containing protein [Burkholderiaceae bacterium]